MRSSDWSSDVCSSDLVIERLHPERHAVDAGVAEAVEPGRLDRGRVGLQGDLEVVGDPEGLADGVEHGGRRFRLHQRRRAAAEEHALDPATAGAGRLGLQRPEEHTSELQSLMRNSYADFGLKKKKKHNK